MNKIILVGNLVNDAEVKVVGDKGAVKARFTLACNERLGKDKEKVNFIPCEIWGKMAENIADYLVKGMKVAVTGRLDVNTTPSKEYEGVYNTYVTVNVSELDFCSSIKKEEVQGIDFSQKVKEKKQPIRK